MALQTAWRKSYVTFCSMVKSENAQYLWVQFVVKSTQFAVSTVHEVHSDDILHALSTGNFRVHLHEDALRLKQTLLNVASAHPLHCLVSLLLAFEV